VHELARRFRTRRETIYRDLRVLQEAGYPIVGDEGGRLSHPRLATQNVTGLPQLQLTDDEIASLIWAASEQGPKQPFGHALPSAAAKLRGLAAIRKNQVASDLDWTLVAQTRGRKDYTLHHPRITRLVKPSFVGGDAASDINRQTAFLWRC